MGNSLHKIVGKNPFTSHTASDEWPLASQLVGVELELEGLGGREADKLIGDTAESWSYHNDGSLRNGGIEMVLTTPMMGKELSRAISLFFSRTSTFPASSSRASTHVHLNMLQTEDTVEVLRNLCSFYYAIEDSLYSCISESRKWAVYASPMSSNFPYEVAMLFSEELDRNWWIKHLQAVGKTENNNGRHYGFNLKAMLKYGTVEFRHFPAVTSEQELRDWVNLCMEIKKVAVILDSKGLTTKAFFNSVDSFDQLVDLMPIWGYRLLSGLDRREAISKIEALYELLPVTPKYTGNMGSYEEHVLFKESDKIPKSKRPSKKKGLIDYEALSADAGLFNEEASDRAQAQLRAWREVAARTAGRPRLPTTEPLRWSVDDVSAEIRSTRVPVEEQVNLAPTPQQATRSIFPPSRVAAVQEAGRLVRSGRQRRAEEIINQFSRLGVELDVTRGTDGRVLGVIDVRTQRPIDILSPFLA